MREEEYGKITFCEDEKLRCIFCKKKKRWLGNIVVKVCQLEIEVTVCPKCAETHTIRDLWKAVASRMVDLAKGG
ncbi:MAG TPA: hypothetical protein ENH14_00360 [candidate division WOR-3 bacterium]|uniref:Uncharacterized protein n=1 Tax=candidate division WOR-3 bacterium TaxID=2052148 RepID=A0A7V0LTB3_UNCW3|nr:hypothetical protein [candidate division WOR-3 bacterium]